ncbi:hypothetical protein FHL15_009458 [Xylaria flabelliformis]|uniref:RelA/SpoT domain-containing protein n=1 Tax=Xylaria flabelliformis TaxID=2512241 RepID=A0A553HP15_9PEZI|nr:hypothetical protein FHL15_009458 [Xylaria flabelliformis]
MESYDVDTTLEALHQWHSEKHDTIQLYTTEVQRICISSLRAAQIRHSPITYRIKTWDSAREKIKQQKLENSPLDEMKRCLHDFGGIRISVYFPGDVNKVVEILKEHLRVDDPKKKETKDLTRATFRGYRATHIMVQLKESEIPQDKMAWEVVKVEIQIATLVMNVWSEIEHDMIYKPRETLGQEISKDERRLLDLINGIVMTGEVALEQLEASTQERLNRGANNDHTAAFDWHGLAVWIGEYHRDKNKDLGKGEWNGLKQLHGILDAIRYNQHKKIYALLDALYQDSKVTTPICRENLPNLLLKHFCEQDTDVIRYVQPPASSNPLHRINFARDLGLQLLYSLSIAIYLGIGDRFSDITQIRHQIEHLLPSLVEFLDLMHPNGPIYDMGTPVITRIADFCQVILDRRFDDPDLKICIELPKKGLIVHGVTSKGLSRIIFPSLLLRFFPLKSSHYQCQWDDLRILDHIRERIHQNDQRSANDIVVWGEASSPEYEGKLVRPLDKRFFLPTEPSSTLEGRWRLEDIQDELELKLVYDWKDEHRLDHLPLCSNHSMTKSSCDVLELAYRLYPEEKCDTVLRAWQNAYGLPVSSERYDMKSNQAAPINAIKNSGSQSTVQQETIKREASPIPTERSLQGDEFIWDPLVRPRSSHSDNSPRYEMVKWEASPSLEPTNTSRISGRAKTLEPEPIRTDSAELSRPTRSVTPGPSIFPNPGTAVAQTTLYDILSQPPSSEKLRSRRHIAVPGRDASTSPFRQSTIGVKSKFKYDSSYDSSERKKKRKLD